MNFFLDHDIPERAVTSNDLLFGKHILLRKGKKNYVVVTAKAS